MKFYNLFFAIVLFVSISHADDSFKGKISFNESSVAVGSPTGFKAEIMLSSEDHAVQIRAIEGLFEKNDELNFRFFGPIRVAHNQNNADVLEIEGGVVFLNASQAEAQALVIRSGKIKLVLQSPSLQLAETTAAERPEIFKIALPNGIMIYLIAILLISLIGGYYQFKKKKIKKAAPKRVGPTVQTKEDVEVLYTYLQGEIKREMPVSQKNKYSELIKNIDEVQYKRVITAEELARIEIQLLEIQKEQNGNRI